MRLRILAGGLVLGLGLWHAAGPATAQPLLTNPQEIAHCLCVEQALSQRASEMSFRRQAYEQRSAELAELDRRIAQERRLVNESDPFQVASFRDLVERRDRLAGLVDNQLIPDLQASVGTYNAAVDEHRARCTGRSYDPTVTARVQASLVCPR